ncbi:MAG: hypothetical protein CBE21_00570 [Proteobacteria bacterium TMED261]|nr:MAG: hypothetical protein CBE21_00570 [Proteobacteria bacterium TMED261]
MSLLNFMSEVGVPIFGAVVMAFFIFLSMKYIFDSVIGQIKSTENIIKMLETRASVMNNDILKIDLLVSSALELTPPIDRVARAENFVEDGKIDARRD